MTQDRSQTIERLLRDALSPSHIQVKDQSHLHEGHAGAREGKGHFEVTIISEQFADLNRIARHRLVYAALGNYMQTDVHALSINAYSPSER